MSDNIQKTLLHALNNIIGTKKKTIYGVSKSLRDKYPNAAIFEFISILSYNQGKEIIEQLKSISLLDFFEKITDFKIKAFEFFLGCVKGKIYEDNKIVVEKFSEIINSIPTDSLVMKYINIIKPLIEMLDKITQIKMKLYIMIPNAYNFFYSEISKVYDLFPKNPVDFYSYSKIKENTETIKLFVEKNKKKFLSLSAMNEQILKIQLDLAEKYEELKLKNNEANLKYEELKLKNNETNLKYEELKLNNNETNLKYEELNSKYEGLNSKYEGLNLKYERLQNNLYLINFRDSIKSFLDELMEALNIFNPNSSSHTMKIEEIKTKINQLINDFEEEEKKCALLLIDILDKLKTINKNSDDLSYYFNNLGFDIELLPNNVKEKYLLFKKGNNNYDVISLVTASLGGYIKENEQHVLNQFLHDIYPIRKSPDEIKFSIKEHSKKLFL